MESLSAPDLTGLPLKEMMVLIVLEEQELAYRGLKIKLS